MKSMMSPDQVDRSLVEKSWVHWL